jgi:hypothetical protein
MVRGRVVAALRSLFDFLVLNLALLLTSLLVLTMPAALNAAAVALERWRTGGEDRVLREFARALGSYAPKRTTLVIGTPLAVAAVSAEEVHYFARGGSFANWVCLGLGSAALWVALTSIGYVVVLWGRHPETPVPDLWSFCVHLALRNSLVTGPLFVAEVVGAVLAGLLDPALLLIGLPLASLAAIRLTAGAGLRRGGYNTRIG